MGGRLIHAAVTVSPLGRRRSNAGYVVVVDDLTELLARAKSSRMARSGAAHRPRDQKSADAHPALRRKTRPATSTGNGEKAGAPEFVVLGQRMRRADRPGGRHPRGLVNEFSQFARFPVARLDLDRPQRGRPRRAGGLSSGRLDDVRILHRSRGATACGQGRCGTPAPGGGQLDRQRGRGHGGLVGETTGTLPRDFHAGHDTVEIAVSDSGQGISPEDKDKLFLPHFSTKERGTGLGLAIASRIIAEHHGLIRAEDNLPAGARFVIELPVMAGRTSLRTPRHSRHRKLAPGHPPMAHSILIVDDEEGIRHSLCSILSEEGYAVEAVPQRRGVSDPPRQRTIRRRLARHLAPQNGWHRNARAHAPARPFPDGRHDFRPRQYRNGGPRHQTRRLRFHRKAALHRKNHPLGEKRRSNSCAWRKKTAGCARSSDTATRSSAKAFP